MAWIEKFNSRAAAAGAALATTGVLMAGCSAPEEARELKDAKTFDIQFNEVDYAGVLASPPDALDLDGADTPANVIAQLTQKNVYTICYTNAGAAEEWRADYKDFPPSAIGKAYTGWEGEKWLDIRDPKVREVISKRLDECKEKGFRAVDPDNLDVYQQKSGFDITREDQLEFLTWLAKEAHGKGLAILLKNAPDLVDDLVAKFDGAVVEDCAKFDECEVFGAFTHAGKPKPVFYIGYPGEGSEKTCPTAKENGFVARLKTLALDGQGMNC